MDFLDSSFFQNHRPQNSLPTPQEVRAHPARPGSQPDLVKFGDLGLIVKFGLHVIVEEALCTWGIRKVLLHGISVPEVYGWRVDGSEVFIYMELIPGVTLKERWDTLSDHDKSSVCDQLRKIIKSFRRLEQDTEDIFIASHRSFAGSINRGALQDYVFEDRPRAGPFTSVGQFNDYFSQLPQFWRAESERIPDPYRSYLPDDAAITFTHGDLHRENILITPTGSPQVLAAIDWAHGGWYPDYWEYCKVTYTALYTSSWRNQWAPKFIEPREEAFEVVGGYCMAMGSV